MSSADIDMQAFKSLRSQFSQALKEFASSSSSFQVLNTIPSTSAPTHGNPILTRVLYVLDSSFNPPSKAHSALVKAALASQATASEIKDQNPRVLFLLATVNADKKPKPADFEDRIVMMSLAAEGLRSSFSKRKPIIDIGITKMPYFADKASSIVSSNIYRRPRREEGVVEQIHLTGFDTLLRIFTPKYYPDHDPPLSALEPFLKHHRVRATIRVDPDSPSENLKDAQETQASSQDAGSQAPDFTTVEGQKRYHEDIKNGSLEGEGMKRKWAGQVDLVVDESGETEGVSSTNVRNAVKDWDWEEVERLVGPGVRAWIQDNDLYLDNKESGRL